VGIDEGRRGQRRCLFEQPRFAGLRLVTVAKSVDKGRRIACIQKNDNG
jgi:hypothetical protein